MYRLRDLCPLSKSLLRSWLNMSRIIKIAAAQVGQIHRGTQKEEVVTRLIRLLNDAGNANVQLVVFPECILMTFFPRCLFESQDELDKYFRT